MTSDQDRRLAEIVEAETAGLTGDADALARMRATIARIAEAAILAGTDPAFRGRARRPGAAGGAVETAIRDGRQGAHGAHGGRALPPAAPLWPSGSGGTPDRAETLPAAVRWIADPQEIANTADFTLGTGRGARRFRFFERARASDDGPAYVSALTETGVPAAARRGRRRAAWFLGILASAMFLFATLSIAWTGRTLVDAYTLLVQPDISRTAAGVAQKPATLVGAVAAARAVCAARSDGADARAWQNPEIRAAWRTALGDAMRGSSPDDRGIDTAVPILNRTLGFGLARVQHAPGLSLGLSVGIFVGSIVLLAVALGLGTTGNAFGIWIGAQNRVSLASFQVSLWTAALLGPYAAYVFFNAALIGGSLRETLSGVFPSIPYPILGALGISVAGAELAGVVKSLKEGASPGSGAAASAVQRVVDVKQSDLARNPDPSQANLAELFLGETEVDRDRIDLARLQNVIITLILVFGYLMALFGKVHLITHEAILTMLSSNLPLVASLPDPDGNFLTLLIASHAAYLYAKAKAG